jgi:hypothetical protein
MKPPEILELLRRKNRLAFRAGFFTGLQLQEQRTEPLSLPEGDEKEQEAYDNWQLGNIKRHLYQDEIDKSVNKVCQQK